MSEIIGRECEVGLGREYTRGLARSTAEKWLKRIVCNIIPRAEHAVDESSHGVLEDSDNRRVVKKWTEGELSGHAHADAIGYIFLNLYGTDTESTLDTGVYQHIYSLAQNIQHDSLSIFIKDGSVKQKVYTNGMVASLELSATVDEIVRFSANFVAGEGSDNADSPSYDTEYDFVAKDISVKVADTEAGLSSATALKVKNLTVNFDAGLIRDHIFGSYYPDDVYNSRFSIEGSFSRNYEDTTFEDLFQNDSAKYMKITIEGDTDLGGGNYPKIEILLYKSKIMDWSRAGGNDELVTEEVSFKGFYNATDEKQSQVTLVNKTEEFDVSST